MGRGSGSAELAMAAPPARCPDCPGPERGGGGGTPAVPHLGIAVDEGDVLPGALRIVRQLRPAWEPATVKTKLFTDGITNKLVACYRDEGMADAVLVRVYGRKTELLVDRETELRNFQVLRAHGCAPDLYCAFQNGLCYQFLPGIALGPDHVRDPHIFRLVAREMARVHAIHANGSLPRPILWQKLHKYLTLVKTELSPKPPAGRAQPGGAGAGAGLDEGDAVAAGVPRGAVPQRPPVQEHHLRQDTRARSLHRLRVHGVQLPGLRHWEPLQ
ncbi:ethanolamine kinase 2 isoform X1 [Corvus kubaryi]|uniref:ethanolamine kinase 2 isoform X1 n=1 Tax=Corvus kubaryi TaxID=68294 RepID=UPI001C05E8E2|nr:ethanolamine kinase 2 isoform X1 [Corvus kubaryi]